MGAETFTPFQRRAQFDMTWRDRGNCAAFQAPAELFYPEDRYGDTTARYRTYKREVTGDYCIGCPVRLACLTHAMTRPERYGLWAGTDHADRKSFRVRAMTPAEALAEMERREVPPLHEGVRSA